ncbi:MAG: 2-C-methyl-D-erythritol 4-phosphate cytidylyltransferase [Rubrivivax sp.]|nr:2-C-methyl-D-erythritol 4-phosphate cytidylyltransferase [Rubrivivax sp.]
MGARAGTALPKQYTAMRGRPLVAHTLQALRDCKAIHATLVVIGAQDRDFEQLLPATEHDRNWLVRAGGATRALTVLGGLAALRQRGARDQDWVLVHDAARCLLRPEWVERLIAPASAMRSAACWRCRWPTRSSGNTTGVPPDAAAPGPWAAQTPQMFRLALLEQALARAGGDVTDEASAIEALGHRPLLVSGEWENLKITWPADFALAERLLGTR